jgi:four helix bundle protein
MQSYRDLLVWQKSMDLVVAAYKTADRLPKQEQYGLISQMQRAAVSVPANIAEGHGHARTGEYLHHLAIAHGSLMELETHFMIAMRLQYLNEELTSKLLSQACEVGRMLNGLIRSVQSVSR